MKVRTDYVSNSSTSSFVLIGDAFNKRDFENSSFFKTCLDNDDQPYCWENKCCELGLVVERGLNDYYDEYVVGLRYADMKADETKSAFHKRTEELLRKAFPEKDDINVDLRSDAGYDG